MRALILAVTAAALSAPAFAAEEWHVVSDGANAWAYNKGGTFKDEATGATVVKLGRYHGTPQTDGAVTYSFDFRNYRVDCTKGKVQQVNNERFTNAPAPAQPAVLPADKPWIPTSFGWPLRLKQFVCDGTGLEKAVKAPSKVAAMALMTTIAEKPSAAATPAAASSKPAATAAAPDAFCTTIRKVLGEGQKETPLFKSFYLNEAERQKYAGLGSTPIEGFGTCNIQQNMTMPGRMSPMFGSYYCARPAAAESDSAAFAASVSSKVAACLQSAYFVESNDGGMTIKRYMHEMVMQGYPRVRVVHEKDHRVVIYLDTKGM
jgi:hypothetical protein